MPNRRWGLFNSHNGSEQWRTIIAFCLLHSLIFLFLFGSGLYGYYYQDDFSASYLYVQNLLHNRLPYLSFPVEYPPLGVAFILLPGIISGAVPALYAQALSIEMLLFDLAGVLTVAAVARRLNLSQWKTLGVYTLALLGLGPLITVRYDLIPAVITLLAIFTFIQGNHKTSWALLAAGTMTKLFPAVLMPVFLIYHLLRHDKRKAVEGLAVFCATCAVIMLPPLLLSPEGLLYSLTYHLQRPLQIESLYSSVLLVGQLFGLTSLKVHFSFGSDNVISPLADGISTAAFPITLAALAVVYYLFYRSQKNGAKETTSRALTDSANVLDYSFLAILAFITANKVLSPQYIIWLYPLIPLISGRAGNIHWLLFIVIGLMSYYVYVNGAGLENGTPAAVSVLFLRNAALIALAFLTVKRNKLLRRDKISNID